MVPQPWVQFSVSLGRCVQVMGPSRGLSWASGVTVGYSTEGTSHADRCWCAVADTLGLSPSIYPSLGAVGGMLVPFSPQVDLGSKPHDGDNFLLR